jgi:NAD(P)H-flavin reductase
MPSVTESAAQPAAGAGTDPMRPRPFVVTRTHQDTRDTYTLALEPLEGPPISFAAGQFTMLHAFGVGEAPISISGDPTRPGPLLHTIRNVGSVTASLATAPPGTVVGVRGPFGTGWDVSDGKGGDVVVVAGGIGLAPLRPALLQLAAERDEYDRVVLLYGARTPEDILFGDDLFRWAKQNGIVVEVTVDNGQHAWRGRVGLVTQLVARAGFDAWHCLALVCGPEVMMRYSAQALAGRGVGPDKIRVSMERNMKCGVGLCGHCQFREMFLCVDGPVLTFERLAPLMARNEL